VLTGPIGDGRVDQLLCWTVEQRVGDDVGHVAGVGEQRAQTAGVPTGELVRARRQRRDLRQQVGTDAVELLAGEEVLDDDAAVALDDRHDVAWLGTSGQPGQGGHGRLL